MIETFAKLPDFLSKNGIAGCFADTSVLFSFSFPFDKFNEKTELALRPLNDADIPIYTNVNVKAEFLENQRRVQIPECLIDFYDDLSKILEPKLADDLADHKKRYRESMRKNKAVKFDVQQIAFWKRKLSKFSSAKGSGWEIFCQSYLTGKLDPLWDGLSDELNIEFISVREGDKNPHLDSVPEWKNAISLMGRHGIASNDAMILNMFLCSNIPVLLTADIEMAEVALKESLGKKVIFIPDVEQDSESQGITT